ncbi:MAG: G8 domain-containing protein [Pseudomonadota bacterium]
MVGATTSGGHGNPQLDLFPVNAQGEAPRATHVAVNDGDWFDPATWEGGKVPSHGALVHIPEDVAVQYDGVSNAKLFMVRVDGKLTFTAESNAQTKMIVDTMITAPTSTLEVLASRATDGDVDIVFAEGAPAGFSGHYQDHSQGDGVLGRYDWDPSQLSLGLVASGEVVIKGQEVEAHMKVLHGPRAGDSTLTLDAWAEGATTWAPGQQVVVGGAAYLGRDGDGAFQSQDEVRTITLIETVGDKMIVHLDEPLDYDHRGPADPETGQELTVSVGNLTRNVTLSSEVADKNGDGLADRAVSVGEDPGAEGHLVTERGHVMFMHNDDVTVKNASFFGLGRTDKSQELDDFQTKVDTGSTEFNHRLWEDANDNGLFDEGVDTWLTTPADEIQNMRGRYALHVHMAGVGHDHNHGEMDAEGGMIGPCARTGDPICHCGSIDEDGDGRPDFYIHAIDDPDGYQGLGTLIDTDNDGRLDSVRHSAEEHARLYGDDRGALIEGNVVWGSPGWGIVQHDSKADLIGNVTYDIDGAAIVSESGNETGRWEGNATFTTYGTRPEPGNDDSDDFNDNFGHEGVGFWLHSRAIEVVDNVAHSSARTGFRYQQNGVDLKEVSTSELDDMADIAHGAETVAAEDVPITLFDGNEAIAAQEGIRIITDPLDSVRKFNDAYSHLTDFTAWEIAEAGVKTTYTSKYIFRDFLLLGSDHENGFDARAGFFFKVSSADITVVDSHVEGFAKANESWFKVGDRQEYRRGYWDPLDPWGGDWVELHEGAGLVHGIDNPAYNLWNQNIVNLTSDNLTTRNPLGGRNIEIDGEVYSARRVWDEEGAQGDAPAIRQQPLQIDLVDDSANGGLVALWREDLKNADDYEAVLREHIPLAYQDAVYLSRVEWEDGKAIKRKHREDDGKGIADDIWSGTALEFVKTDSLGQQVFTYGDFSPLDWSQTELTLTTNEKILFTKEMIDGVLATEGFYSSPGTSMKFVAMRMIFTDRLTAEYTTKEFLVGLDMAWELPAGAVNNGLYIPHEHSVVAESYAVFREGEYLENWRPVVPQLGEPVVEEVPGLSYEDALALLRDAEIDALGRDGEAYGSDAVTGLDTNARVDGTDVADQIVDADDLTGGGSLGEGAAWTRRAVTGTDQDDRLKGGAGADLMSGGAGDDLLQGRHGDDRLVGGAGDDVLHGGGGSDMLIGGLGADRFRFDAVSGDDTIREFDVELDMIEILHTGLAFEEVTFTQDGADVLLDYAGQTIRVQGVSKDDLDPDNVLVA